MWIKQITMIETIADTRKTDVPDLKLKLLTVHNDTPLAGEITVKDKFGIAHLHFEFQTRLGRKRMNDFVNEAFAGKIKDNGYYITIIHY